MQNRTFVVVLTGLVGLLCLYYLSFTFVSRSYKQQATEFATDPKTGRVDLLKKQRFTDSLWKEKVYLGSTLKEVTERELNLGLDLQGGMHVMLEVSPVEIVRSLAGNSQNPRFLDALNKARQEQAAGSQRNFVDLFYKHFQEVAPGQKLNEFFTNSANRDRVNRQTSDADVLRFVKDEIDSAVDRAFKVIQTRVDKFGVTNPNLQRIPGTGRIQVELAGIDNPERVRKLLSGAAKLEFAEVYELQDYAGALDQLGTYLTRIEAEEKAATQATKPAATTEGLSGLGKTSAARTDTVAAADGLAGLGGRAKTDTAKAKAKTDTAKATPTGLASLFVPMGNGSLGVFVKDTPRVNRILARPEVKQLFPTDLAFAYDVKAISANDGKDLVGLTAIKRGANGQAALDGDVISDAGSDRSPLNGQVEVDMGMNTEGARRWRTLTANNVGRRIAILLDGYVYSAPVVNGEIPNGRSNITGSFTDEEGRDLANVLKAGKLPAPTSIVEEAVVGSTLGSEAINSGVISSIVGLVIVLLFMVAYYNQAGWVANAALIVNLFFLMGIMASLGAVLTLPGIAGIVLTIGMAVDANVLIYERIKEELALGKPYATAVAEGYKNAMPSIIDSNVTTLLTGVVLLIFGTGLILGFATTLVIGLVTSLFTAVFVSRAIFDRFAEKGKQFNFFSSLTKNLFKDSHFDFLSKRKLYYTISGVIIAAGIISIIFKGFGLGVDFKGGRTYVVRFEKSVETAAVRQALTGPFAAAPEVKTYGNSNQVLITTSYLVDQATPEADQQAQAKLNEGLAKITGNPGRVESSSKVGPTIAQDMIWSSTKAILLAILVTFGYILIRFRNLAFGYGATVALLHDVLVVLAIFSIFNGILPFSLDVDQSFVAAVLTIMGYSMNDTVVVFDRVREYLAENRGKRESIPTIINNALNSTLSRTAVTGISTMLVLTVLFIFGGEVIRGFSFAMLVGVIVGTYSSLFVATPIVVDALSRQKATAEAAPTTPVGTIATPKGKMKPQA